MSRLASVSSVVVLALAAACQPLDPQVPADPYCDEQITALDGPDDPAPAGLRAAEFIDRVTGPRTADLDYLPPSSDGGVYVDIDPPAPTTSVELELDAALDDLRWVESEAVYPEGSDPSDPNQAIDCASRFEFETSLSFTSADGVFAELFEVTARARVDDEGALERVEIPIAFDPDGLAGSFMVASIEPSSPAPSFVFHELWVEFPLAGDPASPAEARGYVGGVAEYDLIDYYAIGVFHVAVFGGYTLD